MVITMESNITQGGFPFVRGRSYRVHPQRGACLIAGGDATVGAPEGATITEAPAEDGASYRVDATAPEQIEEAVIKPEATPEAAPEPSLETPPPPAAAAEPESEGISGSEALTATPRRAKLMGTAKAAAPKL